MKSTTCGSQRLRLCLKIETRGTRTSIDPSIPSRTHSSTTPTALHSLCTVPAPCLPAPRGLGSVSMLRDATLPCDVPDAHTLRTTGSDTLPSRSMQAAPSLPGRQNQRPRPSNDVPGGNRRLTACFSESEIRSNSQLPAAIECSPVPLDERIRRRQLRILPPRDQQTVRASESGPPFFLLTSLGPGPPRPSSATAGCPTSRF